MSPSAPSKSAKKNQPKKKSPVRTRDEIVGAIFEAANDCVVNAVSEFSTPLDLSSDSNLIYQYTDGGGLEGIVKYGKIWATATNYLNDSQELINGLALTHQVCEGISKSNTLSSEYRQLLKFLGSSSEVSSRFYVSCFSEAFDQLSQWRGYGSGGNGYSVGFRAKDLDNFFYSAGLQMPGVGYNGLRRVIYDDSAKRSIIQHSIEDYHNKISKILTAQERRKHAYLIKMHCFAVLHDIFSIAKHSAFAEEKEVRATFIEFLPGYTRVRRRGNDFIPFHEIGLTASKVPIAQIIVGPTNDFPRTHNAIEALLAENKIGGVEIIHSTAPYRY